MAVATQNPLNLPGPPTFATLAEERNHRKQRLAGAFRLFSKFGFDEGVAGHITARDPEQLDHFWVNPFGMHFGQIRVSDLILVNGHGQVVEGKYPVNGAAFAIHSCVHAARPDVVAAAHAHSLYGKTWATLGRLLDPITQDVCAFYEDHSLLICVLAVACVCANQSIAKAQNQSQDSAAKATSQPAQGALWSSVEGRVLDASGRPIADVNLSLQANTSAEALSTRTDPTGSFRFTRLGEGVYRLRAEKNGFSDATSGPWNLGPKEPKHIDLVLASRDASAKKNSASDANKDSTRGQPEFFDEPAFTVAGVTDTANLGGHGSNTVARSQEALARETVSLSREEATVARPAALLSSAAREKEKSLREIVQREPQNVAANRELGSMLLAGGNAADAIPYLERASRLDRRDSENAYNLARAYEDTSNYQKAKATAHAALTSAGTSVQEQAKIHHLLADVEEKSGNPLDAVREYQRAAELDPNESHLFDWGVELLAHRAAEPAIEVFTQGNRLFPASARMLIGLGVALYAHGANDQAAQRLCLAADVNPGDKTPYLFLGKMQSAEGNQSACMAERFERFARLQPQDPLADYYQAISLSRQRKISNDPQTFPQEQALLEKAVQLDPKLGPAYLQLGTVYFDRQDLPRAISAYQSAVAVDPELEEAHYRLGQAYQRAGDSVKAKQELELYTRLLKKTGEQLEQERHEIQQFVYTLRTPTEAHAPE